MWSDCKVLIKLFTVLIVLFVLINSLHKKQNKQDTIEKYGISRSMDARNQEKEDMELKNFLYNYDILNMYIKEQDKKENQGKHK